MDTTRTDEDLDPETPEPTLVSNAAAMTAVQTCQVQPQLVFTLATLIYYHEGLVWLQDKSGFGASPLSWGIGVG